ncbi:hypothetical protein FHW12_004186 [Dokdonella fugitiva]|uniref:DUF4034 domain-containing protein n=1 Tax=Dokdonella fugitiva TaxID=328517 RepID=A0A839F875_9GAMM|nr:DUF4034 domain-containing protein [Dokdonella fugitiva]MBA8889939.1 hypothetical protein [Dokdonella fugitiva]
MKPLLALFALAAPLVFAQSPAPAAKHWPWDMRPNKCLAYGGHALPGTQCAEAPPWPTYSIALEHVRMLFANPDFDLVQRAEDDLAYSNAQFESGDYFFEAWIQGMNGGLRQPVEQAQAIIQSWKDAKGDDGFAAVAEAMLWGRRAWAARGSGFASTVAPEAWELFRKNLGKAMAALDAASPKVRKSGAWCQLKATYAFQASNPREGEKLVAEAAKHWPDSVDIARLPMEFAQPKWGGSFEAMDEAARTATRRAKRLGKGMYPLLYSLASWDQGRYTLADTKADWTLMKEGFRVLEPQLAAPATWHEFAQFACQMHDREEAKRLYAVRDAKRAADPNGRDSFDDDSDACRTYAFGAKDA